MITDALIILFFVTVFAVGVAFEYRRGSRHKMYVGREAKTGEGEGEKDKPSAA
jgi:hypothetical protein